MAKGTNANRESKSKKITLKMAQNRVELTLGGKRRLDLSFMGIAAVPKCVQKLFDMDEVDLSRNMIRKIPDFIAQFIKTSVLDLHSNYLEELPVAIGYLQNLRVLNLCNNRLTSLPSELGLLKKLYTLNLGLNRLDALPASIVALKELRHIGLSDNRFTRVPGCLLKLNKLESVNMDGNPMFTKKMTSQEPVDTSVSFYLVKESFLCTECLNRCQTERKNIKPLCVLLQRSSLFNDLFSPLCTVFRGPRG
uniref:Leucine rich repeat containing 18 n=1 Tax=Amphilophus citrinellus TaxID=61819 RepID=A0A3Q0SYX5_AMPCI